MARSSDRRDTYAQKCLDPADFHRGDFSTGVSLSRIGLSTALSRSTAGASATEATRSNTAAYKAPPLAVGPRVRREVGTVSVPGIIISGWERCRKRYP